MQTLFDILAVASLFLCVQTVSAQQSGYSVLPLNDHIYELSYPADGYVVKVIASVGPDGILLVDTGDRAKAEALKTLLEQRWQATPKYIIITHEHIEHLGGNEIFGTTPTVIGHPSLRTVLRSRHFLFDEYTDATFPDIDVTDSYSLTFNGEEIKIISVAGGHSGSDLIVWFTKSGIACIQGLCNWPHYPSIDQTTGSVSKYPEMVKQVIDLLPENTKIVPGHGSDCSMAEFRQFHQMLVTARDIVDAGRAQGKTLKALQEENVLKEFRQYEGSYTSAEAMIKYLYEGAQEKPTTSALKSVYEDLYYVLKEKGIDAATARYGELRRDHADEYELDERIPAIIGYMLYNHDRLPEAIAFFQLSLKEYPQGVYNGVSYKYLGKSFDKLNDSSRALENYRKVLELDPTDSTSAARVKALEAK